MSIKSSGMWCDLCGKPILSGDWWNIGISGKRGHACEKCTPEDIKKRDLSGDEAENGAYEKPKGVARETSFIYQCGDIWRGMTKSTI